MELREHDTATDFLDAASPLLLADEARHSLAFGICSTLINSPETYPQFHLWTVDDGGEVVAAAVRTPPFNAWVAQPRDPAALDVLAEGVHELPGVTGSLPEVDRFADAWARLNGASRRLRIGQGIYRCERVQMPDVAGRMRDATETDKELLIDWWHAFEEEALPEGAVRHDAESSIDRRLRGGDDGIVVWEDGEVVALAGYGGRTPNGIRIGPVYTPPRFRRRGYGSALTAYLTQRLLHEGRSHVFLYTDLANPTSNRIYQNIGYEFVCESAEYEFLT